MLPMIGTHDTAGPLINGLGLYFIGKAFFVGPMLWLATERFCQKKDKE